MVNTLSLFSLVQKYTQYFDYFRPFLIHGFCHAFTVQEVYLHVHTTPDFTECVILSVQNTGNYQGTPHTNRVSYETVQVFAHI